MTSRKDNIKKLKFINRKYINENVKEKEFGSSSQINFDSISIIEKKRSKKIKKKEEKKSKKKF